MAATRKDSSLRPLKIRGCSDSYPRSQGHWRARFYRQRVTLGLRMYLVRPGAYCPALERGHNV